MFCEEGQLYVEGTYVFENMRKGPVAATVRFPVAVDEGQLFPYAHEVVDHDFWSSEADTAIFWTMKVRPSVPETVRVRYLQELRGKRACYILRTLEAWPAPVGLAEFVVCVPARWQGVELSMAPDSSWE